MELFVNEKDALAQCQTRILRSVSIMQPSDIALIGGESGTGKTLTCLNIVTMTAKVPATRVIFCTPNSRILAETLKIVKSQRRTILKDIAHLLNNLTIISDEKPSDNVFTNLSLE